MHLQGAASRHLSQRWFVSGAWDKVTSSVLLNWLQPLSLCPSLTEETARFQDLAFGFLHRPSGGCLGSPHPTPLLLCPC